MLKVKHERDCDCVVAGFRWYKEGEGTKVGSLLLGLFDESGALQHVGVCASFTKEKRTELLKFLTPYRKNALADHPWEAWAERRSGDADGGHAHAGGQSRWSQGKDLSWEPLRPELVVEVAYEHMQGRVSGTWRTCADGARTRSRRTAPMRNWKSCHRMSWSRFSPQAVSAVLLLGLACFDRPCRHSRVGSSSGSGVSCGGRSSSGTWRRLTRMRVQVEERPRMGSTSTSSG